MNALQPRCVHINLDDPAHLKRLTLNGAIWRFPFWWQRAIDAIGRGDIPLADCKDIPPLAREALGFQQ